MQEILQQYLDEQGPIEPDDSISTMIHQDDCLNAFDDDLPCNCLPIRVFLFDIQTHGSHYAAEAIEPYFLHGREKRREAAREMGFKLKPESDYVESGDGE